MQRGGPAWTPSASSRSPCGKRRHRADRGVTGALGDTWAGLTPRDPIGRRSALTTGAQSDCPVAPGTIGLESGEIQGNHRPDRHSGSFCARNRPQPMGRVPGRLFRRVLGVPYMLLLPTFDAADDIARVLYPAISSNSWVFPKQPARAQPMVSMSSRFARPFRSDETCAQAVAIPKLGGSSPELADCDPLFSKKSSRPSSFDAARAIPATTCSLIVDG